MVTRSRTARATRGAGVLVLAAVIAALVAPSVASAYPHEQFCLKLAYEGCYDVQGQIYNPWTYGLGEYLEADVSGVNGICLKARTEQGNEKAGSKCVNGYYTTTNFAASPNSQVYMYWGGSSGRRASVRVYGRT